MNLRPFQEPAYRSGIPADASAELNKALPEAAKERKLVKLPVFLELGDSPLTAYRQAYIGTSLRAASPTRIDVRLRDTALGVSLQDRVRQHCAGAKTCCLWMVGYWNETSGLEAPTHGNSLGIRAILGPVKPGDDAKVFIEKR